MIIIGGFNWNPVGIIVTGNPGVPGSANNRVEEPNCVYIDKNDTIYICDSKNNRIQKYTSGSAFGTTVVGGAGSGASQLNYPVALTFDKNGDLYVVDKINCRVQKYVSGSTSGTTVAGTTGTCANALNNLKDPTGVAVDDNLVIYVADYGNDRILQYHQPSVIGSDPFSGASFIKPFGIYIVNGSSNQIYTSEISSKQVERRSSGSSAFTLQITDSAGSNWNEPASVIVDPYGNVYVADHQTNKIKRCCVGSTVCTTIVDGSTGSTLLSDPLSMALDSNLNLYVVSKGTHVVYKFNRI